MRRLLGPVLALVLPLLGCCFSGDFAEGFEQSFNEGFCTEYQRTFLETRTNTCVQSAGESARAECATASANALLQDATWTAQCSGGAVAPAAEPVPPAAPAPALPQ